MTKLTPFRLALVATLFSTAYGASAATLTVNGTITPQTCTIAAANINQTVTLPVVGPSDLLNANNLSAVTFQFGLSGCDTSYSTAAVTLGGTTASSNVTGFTSVIANTGTATNVGIGIIGSTSVGSFPTGPLPVGSLSATAPLTGSGSKAGTLYLKAQIVPLVQTTAVTAGTVAGTATATFTYS